MNNGIFIILTGAGFLPSTVWMLSAKNSHPQDLDRKKKNWKSTSECAPTRLAAPTAAAWDLHNFKALKNLAIPIFEEVENHGFSQYTFPTCQMGLGKTVMAFRSQQEYFLYANSHSFR